MWVLKNRELFVASEALGITHNANKKAHGNTASVFDFVSIVARNFLGFGLLEMRKTLLNHIFIFYSTISICCIFIN